MTNLKKRGPLFLCLILLFVSYFVTVYFINCRIRKGYILDFEGFNDIYFIDSNNGLVISVSGSLLITHDGGQSWEHQALGFDDNPFQIQFVTEQIGWILGNNGKLYVTDDGGAHWDLQFEDVIKNIYKFHFVSETVGWAYTYRGAVLTTNDSGAHWDIKMSVPYIEPPVEPPPWGYPISFLEDLYFLNETHGWVLQQNNYSTNPTNVVYYTNNSGSSWVSHLIPTQKYLNKIHFVDHLNGWVIGVEGTIFCSNDSGVNWYNQHSFTEEYLMDIYSLNNSFSWICGTNGTILRTMDGGDNWIDLSNASFELDFKKIIFPDIIKGWMISSVPEIFVLGNGGILLESTQLEINFIKNSMILISISIYTIITSIGVFLILLSGKIGKSQIIQKSKKILHQISYKIFNGSNKLGIGLSIISILALIYGISFFFTIVHEFSHVSGIHLLGGYVDYIQINYTLSRYTHFQGIILKMNLIFFYLAGLIGELIASMILLKITNLYKDKHIFIFFLAIIIVFSGIILPLLYFTFTPIIPRSDGYLLSQILNISPISISLFFLPFTLFSLFYLGKVFKNFYQTALNSRRRFLYIFFSALSIFILMIIGLSLLIQNQAMFIYF